MSAHDSGIWDTSESLHRVLDRIWRKARQEIQEYEMAWNPNVRCPQCGIKITKQTLNHRSRWKRAGRCFECGRKP